MVTFNFTFVINHIVWLNKYFVVLTVNVIKPYPFCLADFGTFYFICLANVLNEDNFLQGSFLTYGEIERLLWDIQGLKITSLPIKDSCATRWGAGGGISASRQLCSPLPLPTLSLLSPATASPTPPKGLGCQRRRPSPTDPCRPVYTFVGQDGPSDNLEPGNIGLYK